MVAVETICTEKKQLFINICLYSQKITRRIEEIFEDVKSNQQNQMKNLQHLSILIDENKDATGTDQFGILLVACSQILIYLKIFYV